MKKLVLIIPAVVIFNVSPLLSQSQCQSTLINDDFSSSSAWTEAGGGLVNVNNGVINMENIHGVSVNKVFTQLSRTLSDTYWSAAVDFHLTDEPGSGAQGNIMSLTAGSLEFSGTFSGGSFSETYQDGIGIILDSGLGDNNVDNWFFRIERKKGSVRSYDFVNVISLDATVSDYYMTLERTSESTVQLSVFSDIARTQHMNGSPVSVMVNSAITGLNYVQHGSHVPASSSRAISATLDNLNICDDFIVADVAAAETTKEKEILVFPNPFEDQLFIESSDELNELKIFDNSGKEVLCFKGQTNVIDLSAFPAGTYLAKLMFADHSVHNRKIVKINH